ncbi:growth/differentiation factor 15 [Rhineura floridana]|uniref:growth/differentiation factor 15 n=1 Tax=Rhineura floridana TaxID=261503 RepID=UPI002AC818DF|nr:growth/differentiation factor 15 [Rhineura floridana]
MNHPVQIFLRVLLLHSLLAGVVDPRPHGAHKEAHLQLEAVKRGILARVGMEQPPAIREALDQDGIREARQLYWEKVSQLGQNQTQLPTPATTVHLLRLKVKPLGEDLAESLRATSGRLYSLEVSRTPALLHQNVHVLRAELALFKQSINLASVSQPNSTGPVHVNIYKLGDGGRATPTLLAAPAISTASPIVSLRDTVEQWLAGPEPRLHLWLEFPAAVATWLEGREWLPLKVETKDQGQVRKARQLDEECGKGDGKCCLHSLKVSFEAIGWSDWVLAPSSYSMKFCEGSCPHNYKPASMHAQIKARLHSLSGETPAPCCVPAAYEPMVLMHYGSDGKVVTQIFDDMIVTRCHCA